jgi:hypothetical protein
MADLEPADNSVRSLSESWNWTIRAILRFATSIHYSAGIRMMGCLRARLSNEGERLEFGRWLAEGYVLNRQLIAVGMPPNPSLVSPLEKDVKLDERKWTEEWIE